MFYDPLLLRSGCFVGWLSSLYRQPSVVHLHFPPIAYPSCFEPAVTSRYN